MYFTKIFLIEGKKKYPAKNAGVKVSRNKKVVSLFLASYTNTPHWVWPCIGQIGLFTIS